MKIHIVQRSDTFETIANKYGVSVQDLVGMNTHINHLAGLVPGLKVKVPESNRKEEANVAQHIQKYYPNLDMNPVELKATTSDSNHKNSSKIAVEVKEEVEEVIPVPLKPFPVEAIKQAQPNDGVKVKTEMKHIDVNAKATTKVTVTKDGKIAKQPTVEVAEKKVIEKVPYQEFDHQFFQTPPQYGWEAPLQGLPTAPYHPSCGEVAHYPTMHSSCQQPPMYPPQVHPCSYSLQAPYPAYEFSPSCEYPASYEFPPSYEYPSNYEMMREDERLFFGFPGYYWGNPFWGPFWGRPGWGWGRPGWGRPGWGGHGGGHHRSFPDSTTSSLF